MVRNVQTTSATGLRKNRVTQKTRLRVVRGPTDTEAFVLDDEEERNKVLASQGVDAEDANEHHLQAVLNGHHKHATHTSEASGKQSYAHIPIPDAAGIVEGYEALYPSGKYEVPTTHLRFSETVEEIVEGGLAGGFTYFLDERDEEWIVKNNQEVRGEGTSANASTGTTSSANMASDEHPLASRGARKARVKGKDPEHAHAYARVAVDEDEFELVIGLFEKLTEEKFPFIHLALDNFPPFADYEPLFATALSPATFASYIVPTSLPSTDRLVQVANTVYPHWKARRVEREGQRVVPQLDYDDTHESSYICFRRRDAKPVRRTRASSTAYTDKLARLRAELHMGLDLVKTVLEREKFKSEAVGAAHEVWRMRCQFVEDWRAGENKTSGVGIDDSLLFDRERMPKKPKVEGLGRIILGLNRRPTGPQSTSGTPISDQHSPLTAHLDLSTVNTLSAQGYVAVQNTVRDRHKEVQGNVDREMASLRTRDNGWEDLLDLPYQPKPVAPAEKAFRSWPPPTLATSPSAPSPPSAGIYATATSRDPLESSTSRSPLHLDAHEAPLPPIDTTSDNTHPPFDSHPVITSVSPAPERSPRSLRLRTGRGGRLHLDRRLHTRRIHPLLDARAQLPREDSLTSMDQRSDEWQRNESKRESKRWEKRDWQPKPSFETIKANMRTVGNAYWAHKSVYADAETADLGKRKRPIHEEEAIGFERCGYGLGLATYAEWENGPGVEDEDPEWKPEPRSCESDHEASEDLGGKMEEITDDDVERALRVEERWRYDSDHGRDEEDRVMLDDFQPKFIRTMVTLLDGADHDTIMTDSKYLAPRIIPDATPLATRSSTRLGDQERIRLASLKSQQAPALQLQPPPMLPSHPPVFQAPPAPSPTPPLPLPQIASGRMDEQIRRMARQTPSVSPTAATPQANQRMSVPQASPATPTPPQQNGSPLKSAPFPNGIAVDSGATVRVSSPVRPKSHTPSPQQPQPQPQQGMAINGFAQHQAPNHLALHPGHAHNVNTQQYASLRNVFTDRVPGMQQQQPNRMIPGANVNLQVGPGNLNLKLPPTRTAQLRMNGSSGEQNLGVQSNQMQTTPPRPNGGSPILSHHARGPSVNGHYMAPSNDRISPGNAHLLGRASPLAHTTLTNSPHHHSHLGPLHSSQPQSRPTAPLPHQQVVGGAGQGHGYS